jgi:hypothetical protein
VPQVNYTISDGNGGTASSTLDISITPVDDAVNTDDVNRGIPFDPLDDREPPRPRLIVDHIVNETASAEYDLHGTPALLSGVNTALGVDHPILAALNALQSLDGIAELRTQGPDVFGGLRADGPIVETVRSIGFEALYDEDRLFNRDFPDGAPAESGGWTASAAEIATMAERLSIQTRTGPVADIQITRSSDGFGVGVSVARATGDSFGIAGAWVGGAGKTVALQSGGTNSIDLAEMAAEGGLQLDLLLEDGTRTSLDMNMRSGEAGEIAAIGLAERADSTFTAHAERLVSAGDIETAQLMQALKRGER